MLPSLDMRASIARYLRATLDEAGGDVTRAAQIAGVSKSWLYRCLRAHGIDPPRGRANRGNRAWQELGR